MRSRKALPAAELSDAEERGETLCADEPRRAELGRADERPPLSRRQLAALLIAAGSHPRALAQSLDNIAGGDPAATAIIELASRVDHSAKDQRLLDLVRQSRSNKLLVFATFRRTLEHLQQLLAREGHEFVTFSGAESASEKDAAVATFRDSAPIMLCSESGGEGATCNSPTRW